MRELKVGDRVRVRSDRNSLWNQDGYMDKYCGTEQIIEEIVDYKYFIDEGADKKDRGRWIFYKEDLTLIEEPKNYIAEFMQDNGLEIGEEFKVNKDWDDYTFRINEKYDIETVISRTVFGKLVQDLMKGKVKPIKLEPQVDWDKVEKGTLIEVSDDGKDWVDRKFISTYENKFVCINVDNTNYCCGYITTWKYARLIKCSSDLRVHSNKTRKE